MRFNLFDTVSGDFETLLNQYGQQIKVNNNVTSAVVANSPLKENDDKFISTKTPIKRGDHIQYQGKDWYVINEIATKRLDSYKAVIRQCEFKVFFNLSKYNQSSSSYASFDVRLYPCIVTTNKDIGMSYSNTSNIGMFLPDGQLALYIQDNSRTREIFESGNGTTSVHNIIFGGRAYKITGIDMTKLGLLVINVQADTFGSYDDKEKGISWKYEHSDYTGHEVSATL